MMDLVMDTGYKFKTGKETHLFLKEVYDLDVDGINYFIEDPREPAGIVILRVRGKADISGLDKLASRFGGERMYLPGDWRSRFSSYELVAIESFE
jgi:hypothetical protein